VLGAWVARGNAKIAIDLSGPSPIYSRCSFRAEIGPASFDGLNFADLSEIRDFVNLNVPTTGGIFDEAAVLTAYDTIDPAIARPQFFARNATRSRLIGHGKRYWDRVSFCSVTPPGWPQLDQFLSLGWATCHPSAPPFVPPLTPNEQACFWLTTGRRKLYRIDVGAYLDHLRGITQSNPGRFHKQAFSAASPAQLNVFYKQFVSVAESAQTGLLVSVNEDGSIQPQTSIQYWPSGLNWKFILTELNARRSITGFVPCNWQDPLDSIDFFSVLLRPIGVDTLDFKWYDETRYRLEAVAGRETDGQLRFLVMPNQAGSQQWDVRGPWHVADFLPLCWGQLNTIAWRGRKPWPSKVRFRFRDLDTNRVSPLSNAAITWSINSGALYAPLAHTDPESP
jgi:hypothetical protein